MFTTRPEIKGTFGVVTSTHWLASAAGMAMLEKGGNAYDACAAAGFVLQIVEPHLVGPGGDLPVISYSARTREVEVICGQGPAPAAATIAHYRGLGLDLVPGSGLLATVIPGAFDAWMLMLRDHGKLPLRTVLEPAIGYAANGHPMLPRVADQIAGLKPFFEAEWPTSAATWLPGGDPPAAHALFRNGKLARTYLRILKEAEAAGGGRVRQIERARKVWAEGFVAEAVDRFCRREQVMDSSGRRHRGVLTGADMAGWRARTEKPVSVRYVVARAGLPRSAQDAGGPGHGGHGAHERRLRPHGRRGAEARLRRSRGLLWRSRLHRRADRDLALGRLWPRARRVDRRARLAGAAARRHPRFRGASGARTRPASHRRQHGGARAFNTHERDDRRADAGRDESREPARRHRPHRRD
jgi:hypothetical protein